MTKFLLGVVCRKEPAVCGPPGWYGIVAVCSERCFGKDLSNTFWSVVGFWGFPPICSRTKVHFYSPSLLPPQEADPCSLGIACPLRRLALSDMRSF